VNSIKGPKSEEAWQAAKAAAMTQYPGLKAEDPDHFYAVTMAIYKKMCKNQACSPKSEGRHGMGLKQLAESINSITEMAIVEDAKSKGDAYGDALAFFTKGILPDGTKWARTIVPKLGFDNDPAVTKEKKKNTKDGILYQARLRLAPGKGGGGGIGIDPSASNELFNRIGTDPKVLRGASKAFAKSVQKHTRGLNEGLRRWLKKPENFMHRMVPWKDRDKYTIEDVTLKSVRFENPMIDPTRRKWPAGRTEIWVPVVVEISISLRLTK